MKRARGSTYCNSDSTVKDEVNAEFAYLVESETTRTTAVAVLDTDRYRTTRALLEAGVAPDRIHVVEHEYKVYARMRAELPRGVHLHLMSLHSLLDTLRKFGVRVGAVFADYMCQDVAPEELAALAATGARVLFVTLSQRGHLKGMTMSKRIAALRAHEGFHKACPGLREVYGYVQHGTGAPMCLLNFSDRTVPFTRYTPRLVHERRGDMVLVQWHCFTEREEWTWELASRIDRCLGARQCA